MKGTETEIGLFFANARFEPWMIILLFVGVVVLLFAITWWIATQENKELVDNV